ncbi:MAG TPA: hypothetical protein VEQ87_02540 [Burkholderiales bacterium]|nr:hypothetical protein [Burkholderiales bacterium]
MLDDSSWRDKAREIIQADEGPGGSADQLDESTAIVQRLFAVAAQCVGGYGALLQQVGLTYSELRTCLSGAAMPPEEALLRAVDLVIQHRKALRTPGK